MIRRAYKTRRLDLRPYTPADYAAWAFAQRNTPRRNEFDWTPLPPGRVSRREFAKILRAHNRAEARDKHYVWPVFERRTGALVGSIDVYILMRGPFQWANLGYLIFNRYWRKGYGREAGASVIRAAFRDLRLNRLEAVTDPRNRASVAMARALGLRREGVRRKFIYDHGRWRDHVVYVALREDFGFGKLKPS